MSASQRRKGVRAEREAYRELHARLGDVVGRRELGQTRDGGCDIVIARADVAVEVKRQQRASVQAWLAQAERAPHRLCAVMWRPDRGRWVVAMPLEDWCELVGETL